MRSLSLLDLAFLKSSGPISPFAYDTFEQYSDGADLHGLNGGFNGINIAWTGAYTDRFAYMGLQAEDMMESYSDGAAVNGLNGGTGFSAGYTDRDPNLGTATAPDAIANLEVWIDASQLTGLNNNDVMTTWEDLQNSNDFTAAGSPVYNTNVQNGLPGVSLPTGAGFAGTYVRSSGAFTIVAVMKSSSDSATGRRAIQGSNNWLIGPYANNWAYYDGGGFITGDLANTFGAKVFTVTQQTGSNQLYIGNRLIGSSSPTLWPGTISLGISGAFAEPMLGYILELAIYSRVLSTSERLELYSHLDAKWNTEG
jgi:hypothetical protein